MRLLVAATVAAALGLAAASPAFADTLKVPSESYPDIQTAVTAAADGDTVSVAPGTYNEIVMVMDKTNLVIRGRARPVMNGPGFAFTVMGGSNVTITGFDIAGGGGGVSATMASGVTVSKVNVAAPNTLAFEFLQCAGAVLTRCQVTDSMAVVVQDTTSTGLVVEKCRFTGNGPGDVLRLSPNTGTNLGSNGAVVAKNRIEGGSTAIRFGGTVAFIEKNTLLGVTGSGIVFDGTTDTTGTVVSKNKIESAGGNDGILSYADFITVASNTLTACGINMDGSDATVDRNTVRGAIGNGFTLSVADCIVTRNKVLGAAGFGIVMTGGIQTVDRNKVVGVNASGIYLLFGTAGSTLTGNSAVGCDEYGILVNDSGMTVTGNRAAGNGQADYGDSNADGVNTLSNNRFGTTAFSVPN